MLTTETMHGMARLIIFSLAFGCCAHGYHNPSSCRVMCTEWYVPSSYYHHGLWCSRLTLNPQ